MKTQKNVMIMVAICAILMSWMPQASAGIRTVSEPTRKCRDGKMDTLIFVFKAKMTNPTDTLKYEGLTIRGSISRTITGFEDWIWSKQEKTKIIGDSCEKRIILTGVAFNSIGGVDFIFRISNKTDTINIRKNIQIYRADAKYRPQCFLGDPGALFEKPIQVTTFQTLKIKPNDWIANPLPGKISLWTKINPSYMRTSSLSWNEDTMIWYFNEYKKPIGFVMREYLILQNDSGTTTFLMSFLYLYSYQAYVDASVESVQQTATEGADYKSTFTYSTKDTSQRLISNFSFSGDSSVTKSLKITDSLDYIIPKLTLKSTAGDSALRVKTIVIKGKIPASKLKSGGTSSFTIQKQFKIAKSGALTTPVNYIIALNKSTTIVTRPATNPEPIILGTGWIKAPTSTTPIIVYDIMGKKIKSGIGELATQGLHGLVIVKTSNSAKKIWLK